MFVTGGATAATPTITASTAGQTDVVFHGTIIEAAAVVNVGPGSINSFVPASVTIGVGGVVHWSLVGGGHSVLSIGSPSFDSSGPGVLTAAGYNFKFNTAGTYHYECGVHGSSMSGTITVN
jgi:plastocyanin